MDGSLTLFTENGKCQMKQPDEKISEIIYLCNLAVFISLIYILIFGFLIRENVAPVKPQDVWPQDASGVAP